jgi:hypothetical protein
MAAVAWAHMACPCDVQCVHVSNGHKRLSIESASHTTNAAVHGRAQKTSGFQMTGKWTLAGR